MSSCINFRKKDREREKEGKKDQRWTEQFPVTCIVVSFGWFFGGPVGISHPAGSLLVYVLTSRFL